MILTAKYLTKIHTRPGFCYGARARTVPGRQYEILRSVDDPVRTWYRISEGWVVKERHGVRTFREDQ